ncbi:uncharacterized protein LOC135706682 isoform X2 [Ochlerotatus camptorhynchus]|uniref:uncharacterized protein LOC135706682 isoform X2 n=1 Tax=Ochlerotatus camptorhynchus TaxID=644619 RepID=UPI0031D3BB5E
MASKIVESDSFNRWIVEKLAEYRDRLQHNEVSVWKQISLDLSNELELNCSDLRWQDLSRYFKRSLVFKLSHRKLTDDQGLIDRLQYPYLRKVYVVTIKLYERYQSEGEHGRSGNSSEIEDNKLFIKYLMDGRYDPDVVAAFRRRSRKGMRIYVNINVADPAYNLPEDVKKLLLQMEHNRKERPHRHTEGNREERESSPVVLDGVPVAIEDGSPRETEISVRDLLERESFSVNTQEYDEIIKESLERELSPVPKRRRVSFETHSIEIWLESHEVLNASLSSIAAAGGHQEDPLHMSGRSGTQRLDLSKSIAVDSSVSEPTVRSQPATLIVASQSNGAVTATADFSHEIIRIKQEPVEEEVVKTVGNSVQCSSKSGGFPLDLTFKDSPDDGEDASIAAVEPTTVNNVSITTARSQCSPKSIDQGSSAVVQSQQLVRIKQEPAVKEKLGQHESTSVLPPDFFADCSPESDTVAVSRNVSSYMSSTTENREADSISPGRCVDQGTFDPVSNRTVAGISKLQQQSVRIKLEPAEKDVKVNEKVGQLESTSILPPDFFADCSSVSDSDEIEFEAVARSSTTDNSSNLTMIENREADSISPGCCVDQGTFDTVPNRTVEGIIKKLSNTTQESVQITQDVADKDNLNVEESVLPPDFFCDHLSVSEDEASDDVVASKVTEMTAKNHSSSHNSSRTPSGPVASSVDGTSKSSAQQCSLPAVRHLAAKRISLLNDSMNDTPLFNNSLESVPQYCILKKRHRLRTPLVDTDQNVLLSAVAASDDGAALEGRLPNHDQSVCAPQSLDLSADVYSMASAKDSFDQLIQPVAKTFRRSEQDDLDNSTEIADQPLMQRFDISLHLESQSQNRHVYMRDLQNIKLPAVSVNEPGPEKRNHATARDTPNRSSDSSRLVPQESPPMATSPTAIAPRVQEEHASLQPTIESRLRFQVVLRSCWPELFSKTGTFGDFYELLSILAVNLFPRIRPTDINQVMALWPMFSAIASQIAFGTCLPAGPQQSTRTAVVAANNAESLGTSQHSDGYSCGVVDRQGCTAEKDEELSQNDARSRIKVSPSSVLIIEISEDSDTEDLPVRKKRGYRVRQCPQNLVAKDV